MVSFLLLLLKILLILIGVASVVVTVVFIKGIVKLANEEDRRD